jgi:phytoene synthase
LDTYVRKMTHLSYSAEQVRLYDHDRFLTAIFAPSAVREHLFALYAFNIEAAKVAEVTTEPLIGRMRLQWWRDTFDRLYAGETVAHAVAAPLGKAIATRQLDRFEFDRLLDTRELDLDREPPADTAALEAYAEGTGAPLSVLAVQASGCSDSGALEAARLIGTAWALTGILRAVPFHARQHRLYLPNDRLDALGIRTSRLFDLKPGPELAEIVQEIARLALARLDRARPAIRALPGPARSPLLLAPLARLHLRDLAKAGWNPFHLEGGRGRPLAVGSLAIRHFFRRY